MIKPIYPPEFDACVARGHDPGDEDTDQPSARREIAVKRQAWKDVTFVARHAVPLRWTSKDVTFVTQHGVPLRWEAP